MYICTVKPEIPCLKQSLTVFQLCSCIRDLIIYNILSLIEIKIVFWVAHFTIMFLSVQKLVKLYHI